MISSFATSQEAFLKNMDKEGCMLLVMTNMSARCMSGSLAFPKNGEGLTVPVRYAYDIGGDLRIMR
jgi:hypothetical protein